MCGRFVYDQTLGRWVQAGLDDRPDARQMIPELEGWEPSYNLAPTQEAPIVISRDGQRSTELARWGVIPSWWKQPTPPKFATFNARDDKLASSGIWRRLTGKRRCLVPMNGFYEWKKVGKERLPYYIHREDGAPYACGGLYDFWKNPEGEWITSFSIITTAANSFMEPIHDRAPLVLSDPEVWSVWLDPMTGFDDVKRHVSPSEWEGMAMYRVSTAVNSTNAKSYVNDPKLIEPEAEQAEML